jgi:hypothetical protein
VPWSGLHDQVVERKPGKRASRGSSTKDFIEAVRLDVFTPPGSPFYRLSVVVFPLSMFCLKWGSCRFMPNFVTSLKTTPKLHLWSGFIDSSLRINGYP